MITVSKPSQRRCTGCVYSGTDSFAPWTGEDSERGSCEGMDIYWRDHLICPSEEEYKQMISDSIHSGDL